MPKIIKFPDLKTRDWISLERDLKTFSSNEGLSKDAETELISRMRPFLDIVDIKLSLPTQDNTPENFERAMSMCVSDLHNFSLNLLKDRLNVELERLVLMGLVS